MIGERDYDLPTICPTCGADVADADFCQSLDHVDCGTGWLETFVVARWWELKPCGHDWTPKMADRAEGKT